MLTKNKVKVDLYSTIIRGGSRTAETSKMEGFVLLTITIIIKHFNLDAAAFLDPPLII